MSLWDRGHGLCCELGAVGSKLDIDHQFPFPQVYDAFKSECWDVFLSFSCGKLGYCHSPQASPEAEKLLV